MIDKVIVLPFLRNTNMENTFITSNVAIKNVETEPRDRVLQDANEDIYNKLRNLITNIHGESQLIELYVDHDRVTDEKHLIERIESIKQNCLKLTKTMNNMIELKEIIEKQDSFSVSYTNVVEIVDDLVINVTKNIKSKKIIFDTSIEEKFIPCDEIKLQRAILILLSNAVKFSSDDEIFVNLNMEDNNIYITVSFISQNSQLLNIFIDKMDKLNFSSLGDLSTGLYISSSIIKLHGGSLDFNLNGKQAEFSIHLPCESNDTIYYLFRNDKKFNKDNLTEQILIEFSDV